MSSLQSKVNKIQSLIDCFLTCSEAKALKQYMRKGRHHDAMGLLQKLDAQVDRLLSFKYSLPMDKVTLLKEIIKEGEYLGRDKKIQT